MSDSQTGKESEQLLESDLLLDHEYDGIEEYDNPLPGWWVWLFIGSIVFCLPYVMWYHLGQGTSIIQNHDNDVIAYKEAVLKQFGNLEGDEATLVKHMTIEAAMNSAKSIFKGKCAQCHSADGSGGVGPNLTDNAWLYANSITDIPPIIRDGTDKGMPAQANKLSPTEIVLLSSYIAQLRSDPVNPPAGKKPQGKPIDPWPTQ